MPKPTRGVRSDPACINCRRSCRRCDRQRPHCRRCIDHSLPCEYPPKYQFQEVQISRRTDRSTRQPCSSSPSTISPREFLTPTLDEYRPSTPQGEDEQPPTYDSVPSVRATPVVGSTERVDSVLALQATQDMLRYFDESVCDHLAIVLPSVPNPFRKLILPLAYQHCGVLEALLGLSICHARMSLMQPESADYTTMLEHRLSAIQALSSLLIKEQVCGITSDEEEATLATALLLILHDICESGISAHGAHLTGVAAYCGRFVARADATMSPTKSFLLTALSWLDLLRGFSGAEKLAYAEEVRQVILNNSDFSLEIFVGCPVRIFRRMGKVLSKGKDYLAGTVSRAAFEIVLDETERFLRAWSPDDETYPSRDPHWRLMAHAYRHACILRVMRFPDAFIHPCTEERFKNSVAEILDVAAQIPRGSPFHKRLVFPLFMAGVETSAPHLQDYVSMQLSAIITASGFQHESASKLLTMTWTERKENTQGWTNVPWTEYVGQGYDYGTLQRD